MRKKNTAIPVNQMTDGSEVGITIERIAVDDVRMLTKIATDDFERATEAHRHDVHSFFLLENGTISVEIDFQTYIIKSSSVIYIHPNQVHRTIESENVLVSGLAINDENLNPDYLKILEDLTPAKPLALTEEAFSTVSDMVSLCLKFSARKEDTLYHSLLRDSCNALVALIISQYVNQTSSTPTLSRLDTITKAFRELLERTYTTVKRPAEYAQKLAVSTSYLNECVKNTTGHSVSYHIQQRVILEAKRLLYHSDKSVKEIATELGYDDYPYFSRLFTKVTGMTALAFRSKSRD